MSEASILSRVSPATLAYGAACVLPVLMAAVIKFYTLRVPYMDEWSWGTLVYRLHLGILHFDDLWQQHNEHRLLFPNLIALGLASLGGWNQLRETLFSLVLVVVTQIGIFVLLRRIVSRERLPYAFLVASLLLYSLAQMENWDWGFQLSFFLCNVCAVWALVLLGTAGQSWFALLTAMLTATIGSYSASQGLMIWPAGVAALLLTHKRRPVQIAAWIVVAVVVSLGYFHDYVKPAAHPDLLIGIHHPFTFARYIGAYFGSVFAGWFSFGLSVAIGWAGIIALAVFVFRVVMEYRLDRSRGSRAAAWIGLALYSVSVAAITGLGRVGFGETQATASRYTSIAVYCWITIFALGFASDALFSRRSSRPIIALQAAVVVGLALLYVGSDRAALDLGRQRVVAVRAALPAMIAGSGPQLTVLYPSEPFVELMLKQLKSVKDGPYYQ